VAANDLNNANLKQKHKWTTEFNVNSTQSMSKFKKKRVIRCISSFQTSTSL